jgi:hypothetical protein
MAEARQRALRSGAAGEKASADAGCGPAGAQRLQRTLSQLAHWCPLFGEGRARRDPNSAFRNAA